MRLLREPIVHFLVGGSIVFALLSFFTNEPETESPADSSRIVVERDALLTFVQAKTKVADEATVRRAFEAFDSDTLQEWIDRYVREEALVREARALGLDREDQIIRRRLAQKIEFLTLGLLDEELQVDAADLEEFYRERAEDYRVPTTLTLTHVYVAVGRAAKGAESGESNGNDETGRAFRRAEGLLAKLNNEGIAFRDALGFGDRFLYNRNYVDRTSDEIRSHFGDAISDAMDRVDPSDSIWTGPYRSPHGWHLILLTGRADSSLPAASLITPLLRDDALREKRETVLREAIGALIAKYQVDQTSITEGRSP